MGTTLDTRRSFVTGGPLPRRLLRGADQLQHLVGTYLLAGITTVDEHGEPISRQQFHGRVTEVADGVVVLRHAEGDLLLPAEPTAYTPARPGRYTLAGGEIVRDPDYLTTWSITT